PPTAVNDSATTAEDTSVTINVRGNDSDVDADTVNVSAVTQGTNGSVVLNADGTVTYTPALNFNGTETFTYTISDGHLTATATVTVTVTAVNDAPTAVNDTTTTNEDTAATINVRGNDSDVDGDSVSVTAVTQGTNGSVVINP